MSKPAILIVQQWSNSLAVRNPARVARPARWRGHGDQVGRAQPSFMAFPPYFDMAIRSC